jgi:hypothetical protein
MSPISFEHYLRESFRALYNVCDKQVELKKGKLDACCAEVFRFPSNCYYLLLAPTK